MDDTANWPQLADSAAWDSQGRGGKPRGGRPPRGWEPDQDWYSSSWGGGWGGRSNNHVTEERWVCGFADCKCKKNPITSTFCKHCKRPRGAAADSTGDAAPGRVWTAPPPAGGGAPEPDYDIPSLEQLVSIAEKYGDNNGAAHYKILLRRKQEELRPPPEKPLNRRVQDAQWRVWHLERRLERALGELEKAATWLEDRRKVVREITEGLQEADANHKQLVATLNEQVNSPPAVQASGKINIRDVVGGDLSCIDFDVEPLLQFSHDEYEVQQSDVEAIENRKNELSKAMGDMVKHAFGKIIAKVDEIKESHKDHVERLQKKRKTNEGTAAAPATGSGAEDPEGPPPGAGGDGGGPRTEAGSNRRRSVQGPDIRERAQAVLSQHDPLSKVERPPAVDGAGQPGA